jgi:hypothetical protein
VIILGESGLVGLVGLGALFLLPVLLLLWRRGGRLWSDPHLAPAALAAVIIPLVAIDSLLNAFGAPLFTATAGAVLGCALRRPGRMPRRRPSPRPSPVRIPGVAPGRVPALPRSTPPR